VGCGFPEKAEGVDVRIVDAESCVLVQNEKVSGIELITVKTVLTAYHDMKVGEIWVNSPSKARGYWDNPEVSTASFEARYIVRTEESKGSDAKPGEEIFRSEATYLRTGDLGFLRKGELFICGRIKDLIIVRGSNHYPQDIERTAEKCGKEHIRAGCSAAFAVKHEATHTETIVFMVEVCGVSLVFDYTYLTNCLMCR
jgi:acyl-CoA synthetase (AMP-forming)/AMP-acid ligase II